MSKLLPSAPVGVPADILRIVDTAIAVCNDRDRPAMAEDLAAVRLYVEQASAALAQHPKITLADIRQSAPYWKERASLLQERLDALEAQQPAACPATPMDLIAADPTVAYKRGWDDALAQQPTPPSAPVGVEAVDAAVWNEALELPEGFRVAEHLPGIWEYQFDIEDEADEDSDRKVSGTSWNHPALAAIAAWSHAYAALAQQPAACPRCDGTGEADSGGIHPWGAPAMIRCECQQPAAVDEALLRELRGHEVERLLRRYAAQHEKISPRMAQMMELGARAVAALTAQPGGGA